MYDRFLEFSRQNRLFNHSSNILLAVSGGVDSMVMAFLFRKAGIKHAIAHCNFSLRGKESEGDEQFVRDYAMRNSLQFFTTRFDTLGYAASKRISVQMAARELRYDWFESICDSEGFDAVAIAHNLNDNVETVILNLIRGTGLSGLTGMKPRHMTVIRPLLFATRDEIASLVVKSKIKYREDSSNAETKYTRNRIRHRIIPEMQNINPNFILSLAETMNHLRSSSEIIDKYIEGLHEVIFRPVSDALEADVKMLSSLQPVAPHIYELFRRYGLSSNQTDEVISLLNASPGKYIITTTHRLLRDREKIIISERKTDRPETYLFSSVDEMRISGLFSNLRIITPSDEPLPQNELTACIDLALMNFPVTVRPWQHGDRFMPLGMTHMKKISDFLIDLKVPVISKEKVLLMLSGNDVLWVMGYRIDNRYRVTDQTQQIIIMTL
jgi:tRNA(Ile)-lysidine synthase